MRLLNELGPTESTESAYPIPSTEERLVSPAEHRELRRFEAENKGLAERLAAGLNKSVLAEDAKNVR